MVAATAIDRTLAALADPQRRRVVDLLREQPRPAGDLARTIGISAAMMSRHLRVLRESRVVAESSSPFDARVRIYRLRPQPMTQLKSWLESTEHGWSEQLMAFKSHVERGR